MEPVSPSAHPGNRDRGFSDTFATRPRMFSEREPMRHGSSPAGLENRPPAVPKGLENMLKMTTETGDIGMFSIKPSRVPQPQSTPRRMAPGPNEIGMHKTRPRISPYADPIVDDRRRLPSYARDTSTEVLSMYDTASQKSGSRNFEDPDYRSYSMTQTSYSAYTLSNHRSYASLRSQPERGGLVQRPRSPFAYPTRLRRPGFRPSSPALTDGGAVDYSRRVEIDRATYGPAQNTSSPSSLYAQRRRPPNSLRLDASKSTASLLSQSSPHRRSSSPLVPRDTTFAGSDWQRRNVSASGSTSPARSTRSRASTVNIHGSVPTISATMTPGKLLPPSPLYYDYTEEFESEFKARSEAFRLPSDFKFKKPTSEDQSVQADEPLPDERNTDKIQPEVVGKPDVLESSKPISSKQSTHREYPTNSKTRDLQDFVSEISNDIEQSDTITIEGDQGTDSHQKIIRLSRLGYGVRELSSHVEEAFGLPSSPSFVVDMDQTPPAEDESRNDETALTIEDHPGQADSDTEPQSTRTSAYSLGSQFRQFPCPPGTEHMLQSSSAKHVDHETSSIQIDRRVTSSSTRRSVEIFADQSENHHQRRTSLESQCLPPSGRVRSRTNSFNLLNANRNDMTGLAESTNASRGEVKKSQVSVQSATATMMPCPIVPEKSSLRDYQRGRHYSPHEATVSQQRGRDLQMLMQRPLLKRENNRNHHADIPAGGTHDARDVPNFSHQISHSTRARPDAPILAPKPISPARQLKLKNSVPQLMKALPALPPEPSSIADPTLYTGLQSDQSSTQSTGTNLNDQPTHVTQTFEGNKKSLDSTTNLQPVPELVCLDTAETKSNAETTSEPDFNKAHTQKLKLKVMSSSALRPNLQSTQPNDGQVESAVVSSVVPCSSVPRELSPVPQLPKFKLRVIRASDSTQGTVRVTRDFDNTDFLGSSITFQEPKDLFTPSPGLENIFRHFGKHLQTRKTSASSLHHGEDSDANLVSDSRAAGEGPHIQRDIPVQTASQGLFEAHSIFSDDSSQGQGHQGLRKRISNLRARIVVPYTAKTGAHSYDDITWRGRHDVDVLLPSANQSETDIPVRKASSDVVPKRRFVDKLHRQNLKQKVQNWIRGARLAIARVKPRSSRSTCGDSDKMFHSSTG